MKRTVAVIGGGVSGLAVAYELHERSQRLTSGPDVICLEASPRAGGNIRTERSDGFLCEWGPNGFLDNAPKTVTLARRLGLSDKMIQAGPLAQERFLFRAGKLRRVPTTPAAFLSSDVIGWAGKARLLCEPLAPKGTAGAGESVFDFARKRIGREAASILVDAMVAGIYAGDSRQLSLEATFPKMHAMVATHGSLFRAMLARRKPADAEEESGGGPAGPGGRLTSFVDGMQALTDGLAHALGDRLRLECPVAAVSDMGLRGFRLNMTEGAPLDVDAVVLACPSGAAGTIVEGMDREMSAMMSAVPSSPLAVVHFGYREEALGRRQNGFGFLVPREQGLRILGTLWSTDIFEGRAPAGGCLFTTMIGGAHDPLAAEMTDQQLIDVVRQDLKRAMGIALAPHFTRVIRHRLGIPQYTLGHPERLAKVEERVQAHPGLWICGNSYRGISINACVEEAPKIAEAALSHLDGDGYKSGVSGTQ